MFPSKTNSLSPYFFVAECFAERNFHESKKMKIIPSGQNRRKSSL